MIYGVAFNYFNEAIGLAVAMPARINPYLCAQCKGSRRLCGRARCPIVERLAAQLSVAGKLTGTHLFGASPPSILVGEYGYPKIKLGPLVPPVEDKRLAALYDNPEQWYGKSIEEIIKLRSNLIRANFTVSVKEARRASKFLERTQELALSSIPVDTEVHFAKPVKPRLMFDGVVSPVGPSGVVKDLSVVENPVVPRKVDALVADYDAPAVVAVRELYEAGIPQHYITRLLTVGLLGRKIDRRLVPTRWGITAVDSMIGDYLLERVRDYPEIDEILLYSNSYLDNHYYVLLMPGSYAFEMVEIWLPRSVWVRDASQSYIVENFELYDGKWQKADVDGGYKAMRLVAIEFLSKIRRQAMVFAIREIGPGYYAPLGVWNVREGMRHAFDRKPLKFDSIDEAIAELARRVKTPFEQWWRHAYLPKMFKLQRRLSEFIRG